MQNLKIINREIYFLLVFIVFYFFFFSNSSYLYSQDKQNKPKNNTSQGKIKKFSDEYHELDDKTQNEQDITAISKDLKKAEEYYNKALDFILSHDTLSAKRYFDAAINSLNKLATYPNIEKNKDYHRLSQSIRYDYESFVQNLDNVDEDSPQFIILDRISEETTKTPSKPIVKNDIKIDSAKLAQPGVIIQNNNIAYNTTIPLIDNDYVQKNITFLTQDRGQKFFKSGMNEVPVGSQ